MANHSRRGSFSALNINITFARYGESDIGSVSSASSASTFSDEGLLTPCSSISPTESRRGSTVHSMEGQQQWPPRFDLIQPQSMSHTNAMRNTYTLDPFVSDAHHMCSTATEPLHIFGGGSDTQWMSSGELIVAAGLPEPMLGDWTSAELDGCESEHFYPGKLPPAQEFPFLPVTGFDPAFSRNIFGDDRDNVTPMLDYSTSQSLPSPAQTVEPCQTLGDAASENAFLEDPFQSPVKIEGQGLSSFSSGECSGFMDLQIGSPAKVYPKNDLDEHNSYSTPTRSSRSSHKASSSHKKYPAKGVIKRSSTRPRSLSELPEIVKTTDHPNKCLEPGCSRMFKRQEHLKRHMVTHGKKDDPDMVFYDCCVANSGEFDCLKLRKRNDNRAFNRNDNRSAHYLTHFPDRWVRYLKKPDKQPPKSSSKGKGRNQRLRKEDVLSFEDLDKYLDKLLAGSKNIRGLSKEDLMDDDLMDSVLRDLNR